MSKLFIVGNGFDQAHKLPTSYQNFHNFLQNEYPDAEEENALVPSCSIGHHGDAIHDDNEVVGYLMNLFSRTEGPYWSDLERTLGQLDFDDDFRYLPEVHDRDGDRNLFHESYNNEDQASTLAGCVPMISRFFADWFKTIEISSAKINPKFRSLIAPDTDHFLTFNYTRTLETLYGAKNVCHIHGVKGQPLIFGHGAGYLFDEDHWSAYIGCEDDLEKIQSALRKDTAKAINLHQAFFRNLHTGVTDIYSCGFSFGEVDCVYLKEIFKNMDTKSVVWYLHNYDSKKHDKQRKTLIEFGFCGFFSVYDT